MRRSSLSLLFLALLLGSGVRLSASGPADLTAFTPTYRLVFFAVLAGCFEDGLTDADIDQILLKEKPEWRYYEHFIYACPICMPTIYALETYRRRPDPYSLKAPGERTFGAGMTRELHDRLYSSDIKMRLSAIHDLEENWVKRRVESLRLTPDEFAQVQQGLKDARDQGMRDLQSFNERGNTFLAPAYKDGGECAVCNAAMGMKLKLADEQPGPGTSTKTPQP